MAYRRVCGYDRGHDQVRVVAELAAIEDISERKARYEKMVADAYAWSRALNAATVLEVDDVIDPAETPKLVSDGS